MSSGKKIGLQCAAGSLRLAEVGSFHAGGRKIRITGQPARDIAFTASASARYDPNGLFHIEQAYVQYFIPEAPKLALPLVLLHGGGFSGSMWEQTPDGRPGWLQAFIRSGFAVYVVDNVERGRAGWAPFADVWPDAPIMRSAEEAWSLFRFGHPQDFSKTGLSGRPFEAQRFPVANLDTLMMQCVPRWLGNNDRAVEALTAALLSTVTDRDGDCR